MELWDIYDEERRLTGRTIARGETLSEGEYHLVVHACIFNSEGKMLIQQRQSFKQGWPNLWDISAGGSALAGEDSRQAMEREMFEELGLKMDLTDVRPRFIVNFTGGFDDIYIVEKDVCLEDLKLQYEEVQAVRWVSKEEYLQMIESGEAMPFYKGFIEWVFDSRRGEGFFKE